MSNNKWYSQHGEQDDIVISTRIRLARNLAQYPFPAYLTASQQKQVNTVIINAFKEIDEGENLRFIDMERVDQTAAVSMAEKRITSPEFSLNRAAKSLIVTNDDSVSIMLGEEDHIRLQVMKAGLDLENTFKIANDIDDKLSERLTFAFSDELGYLTQCPTNLGTAMRASVLLHLPFPGNKQHILPLFPLQQLRLVAIPDIERHTGRKFIIPHCKPLAKDAFQVLHPVSPRFTSLFYVFIHN